MLFMNIVNAYVYCIVHILNFQLVYLVSVKKIKLQANLRWLGLSTTAQPPAVVH
jgi:hypothetical protein